jgi:hypothetical protein
MKKFFFDGINGINGINGMTELTGFFWGRKAGEFWMGLIGLTGLGRGKLEVPRLSPSTSLRARLAASAGKG